MSLANNGKANCRFTSEEKHALKELDRVISEEKFYEIKNQQSIDSIRALIPSPDKYTRKDYLRAKRLYDLSSLYSFDQASQYLNLMADIAMRLNLKDDLAEARLLRGRNLTNAGFYGVGMDTLALLNTDDLNDVLKQKHRLFVGISFFELSDYNMEGPTSDINKEKGRNWLLQSLDYNPDALTENYVKGIIAKRENELDSAKTFFIKALDSITKETDAKMFSRINTELGSVYSLLNDYHNALKHYILASEVDVRHSYRDEMALSHLAELLFYQFNDVDRSSSLLGIAINNASEYGSRVRINSIGSLMPLFSGQKVAKEQNTRIKLQWLSGTIFVLLFVLTFTLLRYLQRNKQLNESRTILAIANNKLDKANEELKVSNKSLDNANKMKNAYLGIFLNTQSAISLELNNFSLLANQKLKMHKYDDLKKLIDNLEVKYNKRQVLDVFDEAMASLFPSFVDDINALLRPECRIEQKKESGMPPMVRIFALIRLGINDNKEIAKALNYSYNTVLNYRVRMRNMSYNPDNFESDVSEIGL